jgi:Zn-dependent M16 (insulinase) family peptidase
MVASVRSRLNSAFSYLSYRDPNLSKTLDVYDAAASKAVVAASEQLQNDPDAPAQAIISTIGDVDGSLSPDQKVFTALQRWLVNVSAEHRQTVRNQILDTKAEDFKVSGGRLKDLKQPSVCVVSSKAAFEAAVKDGKELIVQTVL